MDKNKRPDYVKTCSKHHKNFMKTSYTLNAIQIAQNQQKGYIVNGKNSRY